LPPLPIHCHTALADSVNSRSTFHVSLAIPAATAGVVFNVMWFRQKLYQATMKVSQLAVRAKAKGQSLRKNLFSVSAKNDRLGPAALVKHAIGEMACKPK
jgi:hypothetical protein